MNKIVFSYPGTITAALLLSILSLVLSPVSSRCSEKLLIGTSYKLLLSTPDQNGMLDRIAKEAFGRIGLEIELPYLPAERSLNAANDGIHDGELNRVAGLEVLYPNLVMVNESMMDFDFVGFSKNPDIVGGEWNALHPRQIGLIKGWKIYESAVGRFPHITYYHSASSLFHGLNDDHIDIALYGNLIGRAVAHDLGLKDIRVVEPPFASRKMYMYLHKKHRDLAHPLAAALRQMKEDGTYQMIVSEATAVTNQGR